MNFKINDIVYWETSKDDHWKITGLSKKGAASLILVHSRSLHVLGRQGYAGTLDAAKKITPTPRSHPLTNIFK